MPRVVRLAVLVAGAALAALALLWLAQRRLLYFPAREGRDAAERRARSLGLEPWIEGGALLGWRARPPAPPRARLVVFHGNAGSALDRGYFARALAGALPDAPLEVLLAEYPGYGPCAGAPSQEAVLAGAREALAAARRGAPGPVLVAGESLGSAVAALLAAEDPGAVDGLLLVTPLASVPAVARRHYPLVPAFVHRDTWRADRALPRYGGRVAFVVAGADEITFADLALALHDAYPGPKRLWLEDGATHNGLSWDPASPRCAEIVRFLAGRDP
jgi:pimeloyl-ACP methyl ester carboxylesterase